MSLQDELITQKLPIESQTLGLNHTIQNNYFIGKHKKNSLYIELPPQSKKFVLWLVSYSLNFEIQKADYYYRLAKKIQQQFNIPGWLLLIPLSDGFTKDSLKYKIKEQALEFKKELEYKGVKISTIQAHTLNKMYSNFLWEN